jgi:hypothetical protein
VIIDSDSLPVLLRVIDAFFPPDPVDDEVGPLKGVVLYENGLILIVIDADDFFGERLGKFLLDVAEFFFGEVVLRQEKFGVGDGAVQQVTVEVELSVFHREKIDGGEDQEQEDGREDGELQGKPVPYFHDWWFLARWPGCGLARVAGGYDFTWLAGGFTLL